MYCRFLFGPFYKATKMAAETVKQEMVLFLFVLHCRSDLADYEQEDELLCQLLEDLFLISVTEEHKADHISHFYQHL